MFRKIISLVVIVVFISCSSKVKETDIALLNGYWEIEKVTFPDGEKKVYKVNETVDFFEINNNNEGFRVKVIPQLDGTYLSNKVKEGVAVFEKEDRFYLLYKTAYSNWEEELLELEDDKLVLKNSNDIIYQYKRNIAIKL